MEISELPNDKVIILFDGVCNLCDKSVQFIIKNDTNDIFRFVSLQSELGIKIIKHIGVNTNKIDSLIVYKPGKFYYYKAEAIKYILKNTSSLKSILQYFIPTGYFGNLMYDYIAKNRYKWYGKKETCLMPTPQLKSKFLE